MAKSTRAARQLPGSKRKHKPAPKPKPSPPAPTPAPPDETISLAHFEALTMAATTKLGQALVAVDGLGSEHSLSALFAPAGMPEAPEYMHVSVYLDGDRVRQILRDIFRPAR